MNFFQFLLPATLFCVIAGSCKKKEGEHLPAKKMEAVLIDVSLAESYSTMSAGNNHFGGAKTPIRYLCIIARYSLNTT